MRLSLPRIELKRPVVAPTAQWPEDLREIPAPSPDSPEQVPPGMRLAAAYSWRLLLIAAVIYGIVQILGFFAEVTVPFFIAVLLSALLQPLRTGMVRAGLPRGLATALTMIGTLVVVFGLMTLAGTQFVGGMSQLSVQVGAGLDRVQQWLKTGPAHLSNRQVEGYIEQLQAQVTSNNDRLVSVGLTGFSTATAAATGFVLTMFCLIFLLHDGRGVWDWVVGLLPRPSRRRIDLAGRRGWVTLTSYVRATVMVAGADAIGIGIGAAVLGVPLAIPIGVLTFLAAFVPMIGAVLSGAVAVLVALVALGPVKALIMLAVVITVQQLESHVMQPLLLGRAVHLHPLAVVLALGAGFVLAGIVGGLFAVPLMAVLNTVRHSLQDNPELDTATADVDTSAPLAVDPGEEDPRPAAELTDAALAANSDDPADADGSADGNSTAATPNGPGAHRGA